jgi:uncharacterized Zn finger protein (UPF0148 family)
MSDFDKEAEREKLRERFAEEAEERETTERMSELLLQGATMTNTHCNNCGDPLFRYDGQTFCPTCQRTADEESETTATADDSPTGDDESTPERATNDSQQIAVNDPHDDQPTDSEDRQRTTTPDSERPEPTPARSRRAPPSQTADDASDSERNTRSSGTARSGGSARSGGNARSSGNADALTATEAALSRTLNDLASTAEQIDDIGRKREHLAATREAAEALDAVRTARR